MPRRFPRDFSQKKFKNPYFHRTAPPSLRKDVDLALLVCAIFAWLYFLFFSSYFSLKIIEINGTYQIKPKNLEDLIVTHKQLSRFYLLPQDNIFLFNAAALKEQINAAYILDELLIKKQLPNTLRISLKEKIATLLWQKKDRAFLIDYQGIALKELTKEEAEAALKERGIPAIIDETPEEVVLNEKVAPKDALKQLITLIEGLREELGGAVKAYTFYSRLPLQARVIMDKGWMLYFLLDQTVETQIVRLQTLLKEKIPNPDQLRYIDLRFGEKIFYQ